MITKYKLFENVNLSDFLSDCEPFLDEMRKLYPHKNGFQELYRGFPFYEIFGDFMKTNGKLITTNKNRLPRDTSNTVHQIADDMFEDKFGWKARSQGVFATSDYTTALNYGGDQGEVFIFFPVGNYDFIYSGAIDDFIEIDIDIRHKWKEDKLEMSKEYNEVKEKFIREELWDNIQTYKDDNLKHAIETKHEIIFNCNEYYLFKDAMLPKLIDLIYDNKV